MTLPRIVFVVVLVLVLAALATFVIVRAGAAEVGPPIALCPGPDEYGYTCDTETSFAYIDATHDTFLYQDDGVITLELPFAFTFYGAAYTAVTASSNGNLQFTTENATFDNLCLSEGPAAEMGDMIAPYWDDLDLTFVGYLETEIVGTEPERIFIIEWDGIPPYGSAGDTVTFEVQLFEGSNDIVFLYESVRALVGSNGSSATVGLQSEGQGLALQFSCNQPAVNNGQVIYFPHPGDVTEEAAPAPGSPPATGIGEPVSIAKGEVAALMEALTLRGRLALPELNRHWLSQNPARLAEWEWVDITGDGREDLALLWRGEADQAYLGQLVMLAAGEGGTMTLLYDQRLSTRQELFKQPELHAVADLTADGRPDVVLGDKATNRLAVVSDAAGDWQIYDVPERCRGGLGVLDSNGDGGLEIVRDGCSKDGRVMTIWDGTRFVVK